MNIDQLTAGRELDALVAEKVMGWKWTENEQGLETLTPPMRFDDNGYWEGMPYYSTNISDAMSVVDKVKQTFDVDFHIRKKINTVRIDNGYIHDANRVIVVSSSLPEAICKAALKAVGGDTE